MERNFLNNWLFCKDLTGLTEVFSVIPAGRVASVRNTLTYLENTLDLRFVSRPERNILCSSCVRYLN